MRLARLNSRKLIGVGGSDSAKFLQGLLTRDPLKSPPVSSSLFLKPNGAVNFEVLLVTEPPPSRYGSLRSSEAYWALEGTDIFKRRKLRSEVKIADLSPDLCVYQLLAPDPHTDNTNEYVSLLKSLSNSICFPDPRSSRLGWRCFVSKEDEPVIARNTDILHETKTATSGLQDIFNEIRLSRGILETSDLTRSFSLTDLMPLHLNYDWLGYIHPSKGCYVGQETMTRALTSAFIRQRGIVLRAINSDLSQSIGRYAPGETAQLDNTNQHKLMFRNTVVGNVVARRNESCFSIVNMRKLNMPGLPDSIKDYKDYLSLLSLLEHVEFQAPAPHRVLDIAQ